MREITAERQLLRDALGTLIIFLLALAALAITPNKEYTREEAFYRSSGL